MIVVVGILWVIGAGVLALVLSANRRTSLFLALFWACAAWLAVGWSSLVQTPESGFVVIAMLGCLGVAVLGARWPGAASWQFVVVGLAGITLLPFAEAELLSKPLSLSGVRVVFVIGLLATATLNYLPTRVGPVAALAALGAASAIGRLFATGLAPNQWQDTIERLAFASAPLVGWLCWKSRPFLPVESNRLWLDFRDRFGAIWSLRVMEQFNRSAANAGSETTLKWNGLVGPDGPEVYDRLCALLKRFGMPPT